MLSDIRALQRFSFKIPDGILARREIGLIKLSYTIGGLNANICSSLTEEIKYLKNSEIMPNF